MSDLIPAVIVDLDGTLSSAHWRTHLVDPSQHNTFDFTERTDETKLTCSICKIEWPCRYSDGYQDWKSFFELLNADAPVPAVVSLLKLIHPDTHILLLTGRDTDHRVPTVWWLAEHEIPYTELFMRPAGDSRADFIVKREIYTSIKRHYDVRLVVDDRPEVCSMWKAEGLNLIQVIDPRLSPMLDRRTP